MLTDTTIAYGRLNIAAPCVAYADYSAFASDQGAELWRYGEFLTVWDDPGAGLWDAAGCQRAAKRSESWGPRARHLLSEHAGEGDRVIPATVYVYDGDLVTAVPLSDFTARDPSDHYATRLAISATGTFGDAPVGFTQITEADFDTILVTHAGPGVLCILRGGETFSSDGTSVQVGGADWRILGGAAFGFGAGRAVIDRAGTASTMWDLASGSDDNIGIAHIEIQNFSKTNGHRAFSVTDATAANADLLFWDIYLAGGGEMFQGFDPDSAGIDRWSVVDCIVDPSTTGTHVYSLGLTRNHNPSYFAGNHIEGPNWDPAQQNHAWRPSRIVKSVVEYNDFITHAVGAAVKMHGTAAGLETQDIVFHGNDVVGDGAATWVCNFTPQSDSASGNNEIIRRLRVEGNLFRSTAAATSSSIQLVRISALDVELRNNCFVDANGGVIQALSILQYNATVVTDDIAAVGNSFHSTHTGTATAIDIQNDVDVTNIRVYGNLLSAPNAMTLVVLNDPGLIAAAGANVESAVDPGFAVFPPAAFADFARSDDNAQDGGSTPTAFFFDAYKEWRRRGAARTAGASEDASPLVAAPAGWPGAEAARPGFRSYYR